MLKKILVILVVLVAVFALTKDVVVKSLVQNQLSSQLGVSSEIGYFNLGILKPAVHMKDLKIYNPEGFESTPMVVVPEIYIRYSPVRILGGKLYFSEIRIYLKELAVERNEQGKVNLNSLRPVEESKETPGEKTDPKKQPGGGMPLFIEELSLKADRVTYSDRSKTPATEKQFDIKMDEKYENVENAAQLMQLIFVSVLQRTALPSMLNLPLDSMNKMIGAAGKSADEMQKTVESVEKEVKEAAKAGEEMLKGLTGAFGGDSK